MGLLVTVADSLAVTCSKGMPASCRYWISWASPANDLVVCAFAQEYGLTDRKDQVRMLASVSPGRDHPPPAGAGHR